MPLNYLSSGPEDVYALNRLGSTFSDMVIGLQLNRQRQQQFMAQQALEQARVQMEREKLGLQRQTTTAELGKIGAETGEIGARTASLKAKTKSDEDFNAALKDLDWLYGQRSELMQGHPEMHPELLNVLKQQITRRSLPVSAQSPGTFARSQAQLQGTEDPLIQKLIATDTPMYMNVPAGANMVGLGEAGGPRSVFEGPPRITYQDPQMLEINRQRAENQRLRDLAAAAEHISGRYGQGRKSSAYSDTIKEYERALRGQGGGQFDDREGSGVGRPIPKAGELYKGYRFRGGDPSDKANWEKANE